MKRNKIINNKVLSIINYEIQLNELIGILRTFTGTIVVDGNVRCSQIVQQERTLVVGLFCTTFVSIALPFSSLVR